MKKTRVRSAQAPISVFLPEINFRRTWAKKGAFYDLTGDQLTVMASDPGCESLFKKGLLYVEDGEVAADLDLKPNGAVFNDVQLKALLLVKPVSDLEDALEGMSAASKEALVELGKVEEVPSVEKLKLIKKYTGVDLMSAQNLLRHEKMHPFNPDLTPGV